jgi:uncharacterized lipoprotein YmbA
MRSIYKSALVLLLFGLVGCASAPAPITYYLLRGEPVNETKDVGSATRAGLGRILVSPYLLSSKGIMVEIDKGEVNPASHHQWAESLDAALRWYLRSEIGSRLGSDLGGSLTDRGTWDYVIDVAVSRLHGTMEGDALIEAEFSVVPADSTRKISETRFSKSIQLEEEGYAGLVEAEKRLLEELAGLIAEALQGQMDSSASMDVAPE